MSYTLKELKKGVDLVAVPTREEMMQAIPATTASFSNFDAVGRGEIDNIKVAKELADKNYYGDPQQANKNDLDDLAIDVALYAWRDIQKRQLEKLYNINGHEFTGADLETTLDDIINDKQAFAMKHGLSEEDADIALTHALIMKDMTPEQRAEYLRDLSKTDPAIAKAITSDAEENNLGNRENALSKVETARQTTEVDSMLADRPESVIKNTFTEEVAGVGANAQSFMPLNNNLEVAEQSATQYDHTEKPFVLDM